MKTEGVKYPPCIVSWFPNAKYQGTFSFLVCGKKALSSFSKALSTKSPVNITKETLGVAFICSMASSRSLGDSAIIL